MDTSPRANRLLLVFLCFACLSLTGCATGSADGDSDAGKIVTRAQSGAKRTESSRMRMNVLMLGRTTPPVQALEMNVDAVQKQRPDGNYDARADLAMTIGDRTLSMKTLAVDGETYFGLQGTYYRLPPKTEVAFDTDYSERVMAAVAKMMKSAKGEGSEELDGVAVDRVRATFNGGQAADLLEQIYSYPVLASLDFGGGLGDAKSGKIEELVKSGSMEMYVGREDGIARRTFIKCDVENGGTALDVQVDVVVSDVNAVRRVEVTKPAAARPYSSLQPKLAEAFAPSR